MDAMAGTPTLLAVDTDINLPLRYEALFATPVGLPP
jgi:hypothetical protein